MSHANLTTRPSRVQATAATLCPPTTRDAQTSRDREGALGLRALGALRADGRRIAPLRSRLVRHEGGGFTLIELLVVISIIAIVVGISFPTISKLQELTRGSAGVNTVSVAVNAARVLNQRLGANTEDLGDAGFQKNNGVPIAGVGAAYSGTGALFTPVGEIRLIINNQRAASTSSPSDATDFLEGDNKNGYQDIDVDYVTIPDSAGVVGVRRDSSGLELLSPPFMVRFDEFGQIATDQEFAYYDGDYDGVYDTTDGRTSSYDPRNWDGNNPNHFNKTDNKWELPFEQIETVSAVILYDKNKQYEDQPRPTPRDKYTGSDAKWFQKHGTPLYFSPQTGLVLKR